MNINAPMASGFSFHDLEKGLPARRVQKYVNAGELTLEDLYRVVLERTFKRRLADNAKLKLEEADAFLALANPRLGNHIPRIMAATDAGARDVEGLLHRFVYGDVS
jgi:Protein of unknown function (DUF2384)